MTDPRSCRLHRWLYERDPRLIDDTDPPAIAASIARSTFARAL